MLMFFFISILVFHEIFLEDIFVIRPVIVIIHRNRQRTTFTLFNEMNHIDPPARLSRPGLLSRFPGALCVRLVSLASKSTKSAGKSTLHHYTQIRLLFLVISKCVGNAAVQFNGLKNTARIKKVGKCKFYGFLLFFNCTVVSINNDKKKKKLKYS